MAVEYLYMDDFTSYGSVSDDPADQFARLTEPGAYTSDPNASDLPYIVDMSTSGSRRGLQNSFNESFFGRTYQFNPLFTAQVCGRFKWPDYPGYGKSGVGPGAIVEGGEVAFGIQIEDGGYISVFNWTSDETLVRSDNPVVHATSETHIEVLFTFVSAVGVSPAIVWNYTAQAYVEGVSVPLGAFAVTDQTTNDGKFNRAGIVSSGGSAILVVGDLIIGTQNEGAGPTTFGRQYVGSQLAASDVSNVGPWVPSTGSLIYPILATMPAGNEYALASAVNVPETLVNGLTPVDPKALSIGAVMTVMRAQKVDGGDAGVRLSVISEGVEGAGTLQALTGVMSNYVDIFEQDPATSAPWAVSAVDEMNTKLVRSE